MNQSTYKLIDDAAVREALGIKNAMETPRLTIGVVNIGVGKIEKERREKVAELLQSITGRKPVGTAARKSVAAFKVREGQLVGYKVTLRGEALQRFAYKLANVVLPRTRDFHGLKKSAVTKDGGLNIGIKDIAIFPEVRPDEAQSTSLQVTFASTAKGDQAEAYYRLLGFPLEQ